MGILKSKIIICGGYKRMDPFSPSIFSPSNINLASSRGSHYQQLLHIALYLKETYFPYTDSGLLIDIVNKHYQIEMPKNNIIWQHSLSASSERIVAAGPLQSFLASTIIEPLSLHKIADIIVQLLKMTEDELQNLYYSLPGCKYFDYSKITYLYRSKMLYDEQGNSLLAYRKKGSIYVPSRLPSDEIALEPDDNTAEPTAPSKTSNDSSFTAPSKKSKYSSLFKVLTVLTILLVCPYLISIFYKKPTEETEVTDPQTITPYAQVEMLETTGNPRRLETTIISGTGEAQRFQAGQTDIQYTNDNHNGPAPAVTLKDSGDQEFTPVSIPEEKIPISHRYEYESKKDPGSNWALPGAGNIKLSTQVINKMTGVTVNEKPR